jgi:hypothetical protein
VLPQLPLRSLIQLRDWSYFDTVSEKGQGDIYSPNRVIETQTRHYDPVHNNVPEPPICLLSRISNRL